MNLPHIRWVRSDGFFVLQLWAMHFRIRLFQTVDASGVETVTAVVALVQISGRGENELRSVTSVGSALVHACNSMGVSTYGYMCMDKTTHEDAPGSDWV